MLDWAALRVKADDKGGVVDGANELIEPKSMELFDPMRMLETRESESIN